MTPLEVYMVDCDAPEVIARLPFYRGLVSSEERARIDRFVDMGEQRAHLVSTALLRWGLARHLGVDAHTITLVPDGYGKPTLTSPQNPVAFNAAQSRRYAVAAFADRGAVGVDVERVDERIDILLNAEGSFSPQEQARVAASPAAERRSIFFRLWTLKEAYAKALGTGLSTPFQEFSVRFGDGDEAHIDGDSGAWWLSSFAVAAGYAGAVAWRATGERPPLQVRQVVPFEEAGGDAQAAR